MAMLFYHLSTEDHGMEWPVNALRLPRKGHGEPNIPRLSLAPTVAQCILGAPWSGKLFIYELDVAEPRKTDQTADHAIVDEHWITEEVLERHGGEIRGMYVGFVNVNKDVSNSLKAIFHARGIILAAEEEKLVLWRREGDEWQFLAPSSSALISRLADLRKSPT